MPRTLASKSLSADTGADSASSEKQAIPKARHIIAWLENRSGRTRPLAPRAGLNLSQGGGRRAFGEFWLSFGNVLKDYYYLATQPESNVYSVFSICVHSSSSPRTLATFHKLAQRQRRRPSTHCLPNTNSKSFLRQQASRSRRCEVRHDGCT